MKLLSKKSWMVPQQNQHKANQPKGIRGLSAEVGSQTPKHIMRLQLKIQIN
jgi:hypothetical protein